MHYPAETTGAALSAPDSEKQLIAAIMDDHASWLPALWNIIRTSEMFVDPDRSSVW